MMELWTHAAARDLLPSRRRIGRGWCDLRGGPHRQPSRWDDLRRPRQHPNARVGRCRPPPV